MTEGAIETDKIRALRFMWFPIYTSFLDNLDTIDAESGLTPESILELAHFTGGHTTYPLVTAANLDGTNNTVPVNTVSETEVFGDYGLGADLAPEEVAFDPAVMYDALKYSTIKTMLKGIVGPIRTPTLLRDRPYQYFSNNFMHPKVKRMNEYTFCGVMFHLFNAPTVDQFHDLGHFTDIPHMRIAGRIRYNEWNPNFDQTIA